MATGPTKASAAIAAVVLGTTGVVGVVSAVPADALPGKVCMTHQQFFDALDAGVQHHLYRKGRLSWGVSDVRCARGWAVAEIQVKTQSRKDPAEADTATEHRNAHGIWHEDNRTKPCKEHRIPKRIYVQFCESN